MPTSTALPPTSPTVTPNSLLRQHLAAISSSFACYRLLDASGREIFRSQPCLVSLPSGLQLASPVTLSAVDSSFTAVESYRIEAEAMRMRVNIDAPTSADAGKDVARLEVWVSPQLHPFDPSQRARCRMISRTTSAEFATLYLPGAEGPLSIATSAGRHMVDALVATAAADNFASVYRRALTIERPFLSPGTYDVPPPQAPTLPPTPQRFALWPPAASVPARASTLLSPVPTA